MKAEKNQNQMGILCSILERGQGNKVIKAYFGKASVFHWQCAGQGTATSDILDLLGIGSSEKDVVLSIGLRRTLLKIAGDMAGESISAPGIRGIGFILPMNAVSNMIALACRNETEPAAADKKGVSYMENSTKNSLVAVIVDRGYTDEVMETARAAGASGGTIIRGRFNGVEHIEELYGIKMKAEREMILILTSREKRGVVMDEINRAHGMKSEAHGILCALPVEKAFRIG